MNDQYQKIYPSVPRRIKASIIDLCVLIGLFLLILTVYKYVGTETPFIGVIVFLVFFLYEPILVSINGRTVGHKVFGYRVVDSETIEKIHFLKAVARFVTKLVLGTFSLAWALFSKQQQSIHDIITKSIVISSETPLEEIKTQGLPAQPFSQDQGDFILPSRKRRVFFTLLWLILLSLFIMSLEGGLKLSGCFGGIASSSTICKGISILFQIVNTLCSICILVFGAQGKLPGAKREKTT